MANKRLLLGSVVLVALVFNLIEAQSTISKLDADWDKCIFKSPDGNHFFNLSESLEKYDHYEYDEHNNQYRFSICGYNTGCNFGYQACVYNTAVVPLGEFPNREAYISVDPSSSDIPTLIVKSHSSSNPDYNIQIFVRPAPQLGVEHAENVNVTFNLYLPQFIYQTWVPSSASKLISTTAVFSLLPLLSLIVIVFLF
ncbi:hypothetical protein CYY_002903 [Polysphondylium violaceum]|uniref:Uncharacterized protein n=1 Tax=Polysphondylium violaceum TaxID=133409 RepID=A0A8J4PYI2_9MYCE|nr:hypothetical protein CYY_002903 [Polysphondylium violaceum]